MRRRSFDDEGENLFSQATPLELPSLEKAQLSNKSTFLLDSKETLGLVAKVNKSIMEKIIKGEAPNYSLSKFLNEVTRTVSLSMTSYVNIIEIESKELEATETPHTINIIQKNSRPLTG